MTRPRFDEAITALRHEGVPGEVEIADTLEEIADQHRPARDARDNPADPSLCHTYGVCTGCGDEWPCEAWALGEELAVQWLGRASDRVWARVQETIAKQKGSAA